MAAASSSTGACGSNPRTGSSSTALRVPGRPSQGETRLYVGNLHPSVDEFILVNAFSKFGHIVKLDFLFHKAGPSKGKPRGYAFVEMSRKEEALKALVELHDKVLRGRRVVVTFANESLHAEDQRPGGPHRTANASHRPTTLSILKSQNQPKGTHNKIAALEAKLASMHELDPHQGPSPDDRHPTVAAAPPPPGSSRAGSPLPPPSADLPAKPSATTLAAADKLAAIKPGFEQPGGGRNRTLGALERERERRLALQAVGSSAGGRPPPEAIAPVVAPPADIRGPAPLPTQSSGSATEMTPSSVQDGSAAPPPTRKKRPASNQQGGLSTRWLRKKH